MNICLDVVLIIPFFLIGIFVFAGMHIYYSYQYRRRVNPSWNYKHSIARFDDLLIVALSKKKHDIFFNQKYPVPNKSVSLDVKKFMLRFRVLNRAFILGMGLYLITIVMILLICAVT